MAADFDDRLGLSALPVDLAVSDDFALIIMTAASYGLVMGLYTANVIRKQSVA